MKARVTFLVAAVTLCCLLAAARAGADTATGTVTQLTPSPGQLAPSSLAGDNTPVPAVASAAAAVQQGAPLPATIVPDQATLAAENAGTVTEAPLNCLPAFATGVQDTNMCALTGTFADRTLVVIGDSHAGNWIPALEPIAQRMGLALVALNKPGCFLDRLHEDLPGWPCADWYKWALTEDHLLGPVATIVAFRMDIYNHSPQAVQNLSTMLKQLANPVYIADPPDFPQTWPGQCITQAGATMGTCSSKPWPRYELLLKRISAALAEDYIPALPTAQWFCAGSVCPMVIDGTIVDRDSASDGAHMTIAYAQALSTLLGDELQPVLERLEKRPR